MFFNLMEASDLLFPFSFFSRMDDIQLCKDIMSLKQELRQIVAVPGTVQTHVYTHADIFCLPSRKPAVSISGNKPLRIDPRCAKLSMHRVWTLGRKCFCLQLARVP